MKLKMKGAHKVMIHTKQEFTLDYEQLEERRLPTVLIGGAGRSSKIIGSGLVDPVNTLCIDTQTGSLDDILPEFN